MAHEPGCLPTKVPDDDCGVGFVLASDVRGIVSWQQQSVLLDSNPADITIDGVQAAGASMKAAAADHVHPQKAWASICSSPFPATAETFPRMLCTASQTPVSGRLQASSIPLPIGMDIASLTFCTGTGAISGLAHGWYVLMDNTCKVLAVTADQTSSAWGAAQTPVSLMLTSPFTTTYSGHYYAGWMAAADTVVNAMAVSPPVNSGLTAALPVLCGTYGSGLTVPPDPGSVLTLTADPSWSLYAYACPWGGP